MKNRKTIIIAAWIIVITMAIIIGCTLSTCAQISKTWLITQTGQVKWDTTTVVRWAELDDSTAAIRADFPATDTNALKTNTPLSLISDTVQRNGLNSSLWLSTIGALINTNALGVTQHDSSGLQLVNNTAAAAGAQQVSPGIRQRGYGWKTNATAGSFAVDFQSDVLPVEGAAAPTGNWRLRAKVGAGAYAAVATFKSNGLPISTETYGFTVATNGIIRADASNIGFYFANNSNGYLNGTTAGWSLNYASTAKTATSGTEYLGTSTYTISPASGSYTHRWWMPNPTINQHASCTGITGGLYVNPTLTAAYEWRSVEWTNTTHWGLYGSGTAKNYLNGNLLIKTTTDVSSSLLTMSSTTQGFLPPVMTTTQRDAISSPASGLQVHNSTLASADMYDGTRWVSHAKTLTASGTLDFTSTNAGRGTDLTITVTGAVDGDAVSLGVPASSLVSNTCYTAFITSANTVTVRFNNYSSSPQDPASGAFKVTVFKN